LEERTAVASFGRCTALIVMTTHPLSAAKHICELRDWTATNLEINKILYIAQMLHLGRTNGASPLLSESFEAWDYGPVLPTVYHRAKAFGSAPVRNVFYGCADVTRTEADTLKEVSDSLKGKTPGELVAITHWDSGAWAKHYRPGARGSVIPNADILEEYRRRVG
jgi:uncharacterized phage-associated protein